MDVWVSGHEAAGGASNPVGALRGRRGNCFWPLTGSGPDRRHIEIRPTREDWEVGRSGGMEGRRVRRRGLHERPAMEKSPRARATGGAGIVPQAAAAAAAAIRFQEEFLRWALPIHEFVRAVVDAAEEVQVDEAVEMGAGQRWTASAVQSVVEVVVGFRCGRLASAETAPARTSTNGKSNAAWISRSHIARGKRGRNATWTGTARRHLGPTSPGGWWVV